MTYNKTLLENYLNRMERTMKSISVSERAEIITEIKSHVLESLERNPDTSMENVLKALGEPETVANRYLLERGLKTQPPPRHPIFKWLVIGFLGTFGILAAVTVTMIMHFSPLVEVNETEGKVRLLGGLIKVDGDIKFDETSDGKDEGDKFSLQISDKNGQGIFAGKSKGRHPLEVGKRIKVHFLNGKLDIKTSENRDLVWNCKSVGATNPKNDRIITDPNGYTLDFGNRMAVKCSISVPKQAILAVEGTNGKLEFDKPAFAIETELTNGKINLEPDKTLAYQYNVKVQNGSSDEFTSSSSKVAFPVKISLINGSIHSAKDNDDDQGDE